MDHFAPLISAALLEVFPESALRAVVEQVSSLVVKAAGDDTGLLRDAAHAALGAGDTSTLEQVLRDVFAASYGAGAHAAEQQLTAGGAAVSSLAGVSSVDWGAWTPGDPAAAALLSNGGLQELLAGAGVTVHGITGTVLDQVGNTIGAGVAAGASVDSITRDIVGVVGDSSRAERIAHTETARAMTRATMDSYGANGVGEFDWIVSDGACPLCEEAAAASPLRVGVDEAPPRHPFCRCAASPVLASISASGGSDVAAAGSDVAGAAGLLEGDVAGAYGEAAAALEGDAAAAEGAVAADLTVLSDDELSGMLATADDAGIERVLAELGRRDEVAATERAAAEKKAAAAARREAKAQALEEERSAQMSAKIDAGEDPLVAYADVYGKDLERVRIQAAMSDLRAAGYTGRNYEELCMSQFKEYAEQSWAKAEAETRGAMLNAEGRRLGISDQSLFTGQDARARKYASEELLGYWRDHGRLTLEDFKAANLGQKGGASGRAYYL